MGPGTAARASELGHRVENSPFGYLSERTEGLRRRSCRSTSCTFCHYRRGTDRCVLPSLPPVPVWELRPVRDRPGIADCAAAAAACARARELHLRAAPAGTGKDSARALRQCAPSCLRKE